MGNTWWAATEAEVPEGFILGPLFFLKYLNLPDDLASDRQKLFTDVISLLSII